MKTKKSASKRSGKKAPKLEVTIFNDPVSKREKKQGSLNVSRVSTQSFVALGGTKVEEPPFDMDDWAIAPEFSTRLAACIFIRSQNVAGMGYELVPKKSDARKLARPRREMGDAEKKKMVELEKTIEDEKDVAEQLLEKPHETKPFSALLKDIIADRERVGNGYMEVDTSLIPVGSKPAGFPLGLNRVIGHTVRIKTKKGGGYIARVDSQKFVHYKVWGDKRVIDKRTGKVHPSAEGPLPPKFHAKELIHFEISSGRDTEYGIPRHLSTAPAISGNRYAAERNSRYFENDATPRIAIIVEGPARLSKESKDDIREFLERKGKGVDNYGRVMIIQAGKTEGSFADKESVKIKVEKLTVGVSEEAGHLKYQDKTETEIAEAFGIHPVYFALDASRASAATGRSITLDQTFEPDIVELEYILNNTLGERMGLEHVEIRLIRPKTVDFEGQAQILQRLQRTGGVTPNDIRNFLNKPKFKAAWADFPLPLALQQLKVPQTRAEGSTLIDALMALDDTVSKAAEGVGEDEEEDDYYL